MYDTISSIISIHLTPTTFWYLIRRFRRLFQEMMTMDIRVMKPGDSVASGTHVIVTSPEGLVNHFIYPLWRCLST